MNKNKWNLLAFYAGAVTVALAVLLYFGYTKCYVAAYNERYEEGYHAGYKAGHDEGWKNGRTVGILEGKGKFEIVEEGTLKKDQVAGKVSTVPTEEYVKTPSSDIFTEIMYDYTEHTLYVTFRNSGEGYCYYNVPYDVWCELKDADSMGSYFNSDIKGYYQYDREAW